MRPRDLGIGKLFERIRDAAIVADAKSQRIFLWNQAATNIFGYSTSEALELHVEDLVPEHLKDQHRAGIARYAETGHGPYIDSPRLLELPALRKGGEEIYIELSLSPIEVVDHADGNERYVLAIVRDTTARKRTEEEIRWINEDLENRVAQRTEQLEERERGLRESEVRYRSFVEQSREGIWRFELEEPVSTDLAPDEQVERFYRHGYLAECNDAMARMYGYARAEEIVGARLGDLLPSSIPENVQYLKDFVRSGYRLTDTESQEVDRHGDTKYFLNNLTGIVESGSLMRVWGTQRDITERKQAEEELRESEERFRGTFEQATVGIAHVATDGRWLRVNRRLCDIVGYEKEELLGLTFQDITHPDDLETDLEGARRLLAGEIETYSREKRYFRKDGSIVWIYLTVSLMRSPLGEPRYFISVTEDITERKRIEEAQRFLAEVSASLSSSLDYRTTLARVARLAVPHLADWCVVDILKEEDGSLDRLAVAHQDPEKVALVHELQKRYPPDPDAPRGVAQVSRTGHSELVPEIPESLLEEAARDAEHREILRGLGLKSYMIVPLVARGRTLGAISLVSEESGRRYGEADLELAKELARRAALAVDNARLYRSRTQVARTLQEGLLPSRLPDVAGVEVGLRYVSAGEVDVGGDFYDLFEARMVDQNGSSEPSSSWGVVIGDVVGKGAEAATVLAFARYTIRALATRESCPSTVLSGLNEAMLAQRHERGDHKFCTVTYVKLETDEGNTERGARITVSRGGHAPPFLLRTDGSIYRVGKPGRAIGVFDDANLTEQEVSLAPGDALILYTDGVVEARSPDGLFFGEERLMALLRSSVALDAS
ncbi:MAG TPA: PAS domain S-box protein, partial [Rubrobacteraceae bacterium]|nr:PAS domain S-box protein [Rubrobacteraceae bacterium]